MAALFTPIQVTIGAITVSVIFANLLMGCFDVIRESESFIQLSLDIYVAGMLITDLVKIQVGVEALKVVTGLS